MTESPLIIALDQPNAEAALTLVDHLQPSNCRVKVGKELFTAEGPILLMRLAERGFQTFLDLKYHDIPNTVAGACRSATRHGVWMLNVHALGGRAMMQAAREAIEGLSPRPLLVAVTILTSLDDAALSEVGVSPPAQARVLELAMLAKACGLDGVVCSALEATMLRHELGPDFLLVTPGIRPSSVARDDQSRTMTPQAALAAGASYLVVGRPVTQAVQPARAVEQLLQQCQTVI